MTAATVASVGDRCRPRTLPYGSVPTMPSSTKQKSEPASNGQAQKIAGLERELLETQARLQATIQALPGTHNEPSVGTWECDIATNRIYWSARLREMLGIADAEV